jgi:hypothetical protein
MFLVASVILFSSKRISSSHCSAHVNFHQNISPRNLLDVSPVGYMYHGNSPLGCKTLHSTYLFLLLYITCTQLPFTAIITGNKFYNILIIHLIIYWCYIPASLYLTNFKYIFVFHHLTWLEQMPEAYAFQ